MGGCELVIAAMSNLVPSLLIMMVNKALFSIAHWPFPALLAIIHLLVTSLALEILRLFGFFTRTTSDISFLQVMHFMGPGVLNTIFQSISLQINSFGSFMILKQLTVVFTAMADAYMGLVSLSISMWLCIVGMVVGAVLVTVGDVSFNLFGTLVGLLASALGVYTQIIITSILKNSQQQISPIQLQYESLRKGGWILLLSTFIDISPIKIIHQITSYDWHQCVYLLPISCILAPLVTLSFYFVLQSGSGLFYQLLTPLKLVLSIILSHIVFGEPVLLQQWMGIGLVLLCLTYFIICRQTSTSSSFSVTITTPPRLNNN